MKQNDLPSNLKRKEIRKGSFNKYKFPKERINIEIHEIHKYMKAFHQMH